MSKSEAEPKSKRARTRRAGVGRRRSLRALRGKIDSSTSRFKR